MEISTNWSQMDLDKALEKVWGSSSNFEDILNFGLEHGFISSSDIIHASDIYKDPNKEYDDEEVKEMIMSRGLREVMEIIQEEYSLDDILDELPKDEILDNIDADVRLGSLENTWELEQHDEEVRSEYHQECIDECIEQFKAEQKDYMDNVYNWSGDELHKFLCDASGCGYYDKNIFDKLKNKLNHNNYDVKYE